MAATRVMAPAIMNGRALWMPMGQVANSWTKYKAKIEGGANEAKGAGTFFGLVESKRRRT